MIVCLEQSLFPSTSASLVITNSVFGSVLAPGLQKHAFQKTHLNPTCIVLRNVDMASLSGKKMQINQAFESSSGFQTLA